jgi:hypothetical protein
MLHISNVIVNADGARKPNGTIVSFPQSTDELVLASGRANALGGTSDALLRLNKAQARELAEYLSDWAGPRAREAVVTVEFRTPLDDGEDEWTAVSAIDAIIGETDMQYDITDQRVREDR